MLRISPKRIVAVLWLLGATSGWSYEVDADLRKSIAKTTVPQLLAKTPSGSRLGVRFALAGSLPFRDYERLAKAYGYEPYSDCTIATFAEIAAWQIANGAELDPNDISAVHTACVERSDTVLGSKPLAQQVGDAAILRAVWQRNLDVTGKQLRNEQLTAAAFADAENAFRAFRGEPDAWHVSPQGFTAAVAAPETPVEPEAAPEPQDVDRRSIPPVTAAAGGADVERMVLRTVTRYGLSGVYITNQVYLLLKDGSIFRKPYRSPEQLDVAASRRSAPEDWGRWERFGDRLRVTWPGSEPQEWKTWHTCRAAGADSRLSGRFQSADAFGGAKVINFNTIAFAADGRFSWASVKGGDTGAWLPAYSERTTAGRYTLRNHAIRFQYNDGSTADYAFCWYPKDNEHFAIGANHFVPL